MNKKSQTNRAWMVEALSEEDRVEHGEPAIAPEPKVKKTRPIKQRPIENRD